MSAASDLNKMFKGKTVDIHGKHPGPDGASYSLGTGTFNGAWDIEGGVGFSACDHTWVCVKRWKSGDRGILYGYYNCPKYPLQEDNGVVVIVPKGGQEAALG